MISLAVAMFLTASSSHQPSVSCSAVVPDSATWQAAETPIFRIKLPPGYKYKPVSVTEGFEGKWIRPDAVEHSAIDFVTGKVTGPAKQWVVSTCKESIGGRLVRIETGIGPTGRYFVRFAWLEPLPADQSSYLTVWADTANPTEQAEALAALRTITLKAGGA